MSVLDLSPPEWMARAHCLEHDPDVFFPVRSGPNPQAEAICRRCPVVPECLEFATSRGELGFWGGTGEAERRQLRDQIPTTDVTDDTWLVDGDDFTYETDPGATA